MDALTEGPATKTCNKCGETKPAGSFTKHKAVCKVCKAAGARLQRAADPAKAKQVAKSHRERNPERYKELLRARRQKYYWRNKEACLLRMKKWYLSNTEKAKEKAKRWAAENPDKAKANSQAKVSLRRARKGQATPPWADLAAIKAIYAKRHRLQARTGCKFHVDHVVPLKGRNACGLHVPGNLRVVPAKLNWSKGNKEVRYG